VIIPPAPSASLIYTTDTSIRIKKNYSVASVPIEQPVTDISKFILKLTMRIVS
jgi:hypothetical protein